VVPRSGQKDFSVSGNVRGGNDMFVFGVMRLSSSLSAFLASVFDGPLSLRSLAKLGLSVSAAFEARVQGWSEHRRPCRCRCGFVSPK
jgi:hypothetical protein